MLVTDLTRMYRRRYGGSRTRTLLACYLWPGFQAVKVYRLGHWLLRQPKLTRVVLGPLSYYLHYKMGEKWGIHISRFATIGPGFLIIHYGGIFIGGTIGKNFTIYNDTIVGKAGPGSRQGLPVIGDNVYIAPGAKIVGRIAIGNNVRIGPNAVVQRSIPDNAVVQMHPMYVMKYPSLPGQPKEVVNNLPKRADKC
jgi:serine O-acetyltransferase